jgi:hypothetical protein
MRAAILKRIEAAHAEIARLIEMEKAWELRTHPQGNEFLQSIANGKNEWLRYPPDMRANHGEVR